MEMILDNCSCGAIPAYFGSDTYGYIECPNCHLRTHNYFDCDKRVEWNEDEHGNRGWFERKHVPNAYVFAYEAWNNNDRYRIE